MDTPGTDQRIVELSDGARVPTRRIRSTDALALQRFHRHLSEYSIYLRHNRALPDLSDSQAKYFSELGHDRRLAIVALDPHDQSEIIAVVRAEGDPQSDRAEYAALVADAWQGKGLGLAMTLDLVQQARQVGITTLYALVLPENVRMLSLLRDLDLPEHTHYTDGTAVIEIDLRAGQESESSDTTRS